MAAEVKEVEIKVEEPMVECEICGIVMSKRLYLIHGHKCIWDKTLPTNFIVEE